MLQRQQQQSDISQILNKNKELEISILDAVSQSSQNLENELIGLSLQLIRSSPTERRKFISDWQRQNSASIEGVSHDFSEAAQRENDENCIRLLLLSLDCPQLHERHASIPIAHAKTFNWVLESDPEGAVPWSNFSQWLLEDGNHLYWIRDKPGSGKSTLMRYLIHDPRTKDRLNVWAKDRDLLIASCFFWNAGSRIQKSFEGLLQTLLLHLLSENPSLIAKSAPWRWQTLQLGSQATLPWTKTEFLDTFRRLVIESINSCKICLFVDGLDEFVGDDVGRYQIIHLFEDICKYAHVKICVSSRPWVVFEDSFYGRPSLLLQELTFNDIRDYVKAELMEQPKFSRLKQSNAPRCRDLIFSITDKALGVFLWVTLVVQSLLQGLRNEDGLIDLQRRVELIPTDLEAFFEQILKTIDPFYLKHAFKLFQVALEVDRELSLLTYSYIMEEDYDFVLKANISPLTRTEIASRYEPTIRRLNSRCKGLLEVHLYNPAEMIAYHRPRVGFSHRTVRDFMISSTMTEKFTAHGHPSVEIYTALCHAFLCQIKGINFSEQWVSTSSMGGDKDFEPISGLINDISVYATLSEKFHGSSHSTVLDELDAALSQIFKDELGGHAPYWEDDDPHWTNQPMYDGEHDVHSSEQHNFLSFALVVGMPAYVTEKLREDPSLARKQGRPMLHCAIAVPPVKKTLSLDEEVQNLIGIDHDHRKPYFQVIVLLLESGADPTEPWDGQTAWELFLEQMGSQTTSLQMTDPIVKSWADTTKCFIASLSAQGQLANDLSRPKHLQPDKIFIRLFPRDVTHDLIWALEELIATSAVASPQIEQSIDTSLAVPGRKRYHTQSVTDLPIRPSSPDVLPKPSYDKPRKKRRRSSDLIEARRVI